MLRLNVRLLSVEKGNCVFKESGQQWLNMCTVPEGLLWSFGWGRKKRSAENKKEVPTLLRPIALYPRLTANLQKPILNSPVNETLPWWPFSWKYEKHNGRYPFPPFPSNPASEMPPRINSPSPGTPCMTAISFDFVIKAWFSLVELEINSVFVSHTEWRSLFCTAARRGTNSLEIVPY